MQAAFHLEEPRQRTLVPKQVVGLTAILLTGAAVTPINVEALQRLPALQVVAPVSGSLAEASPQSSVNLKIMEQRAGEEVLPPVNVCTLSVIDNQKELNDLREKIISSVLSWEGIQYKWGGTTRNGVDCSGLVQQVFRENGMELPRTSYEQFRVGVGIPRAKLEPGDLVFFNTNGSGASHVGIYLGEGQFISATKNCVQIQSLDQRYWDSTYRGSRRVIL